MGLRGGRREKLKFAVPTHPSGSADCFRWYRTGGLKPCLRLLVSKVLFKQSVWPLQPIANLMHKSTLDQGLDIGVLGCLLDQVPAGAKPVKKERGAAHYVIGHSEASPRPGKRAGGNARPVRNSEIAGSVEAVRARVNMFGTVIFSVHKRCRA